MAKLLDGKRILVTGVLTDASLAFGVARLAQEQGRRDPPHGGGPRPLAHQALGPQAPERARRARARRDRPGAGDGSTGRHRRAVGPRRRCLARHRLRAPGVPGRGVHGGWLGRRERGPAGVGLLAQDAGRRRRAPHDRRRVHRRPRLRQQPAGLAGLRLDGCGQGRARVDLPVPGPRPGAQGHPGEPHRGGTRPHAGGQVDPRLQQVRGRVGRAEPRWAGTSGPTPTPWPAAASPCCRTGSPRPPPRSSTSTAASTQPGPDHPILRGSGTESVADPRRFEGCGSVGEEPARVGHLELAADGSGHDLADSLGVGIELT